VKGLHKVGIPMVALLYESREYESDSGMSVPAIVDGIGVSLSRLCLRYRWATLGLSPRCNPILHSCLPRRGEGIVPGTLAWLAAKQRRSVYVERMAPFDFFGGEDLAMLARPVVWSGSGVAKIIIVGVRCDQRELLTPQLVRVEHEVISQARGFEVRPQSKVLSLPLSWDAAKPRSVLRRGHAAVGSRS